MYTKIFFKINLTQLLMSKTISDGMKLYNPSLYALNNKLQREKTSLLINEFDEELKNISGKCMDIGCGPGDITKDIILPALNPNTRIIGTDILENMVEYGNKMYSVTKRLKFETLDIQTKKLPAKYISEFNHVFSFHTLHWCIDIRQAFENIYRMLQSNGTMLVLIIVAHDIFNILENMAQDNRFTSYISDVNKYVWPFQHSINPRNELKKLLREIGFTVTHCSCRETYYSDKNPTEFITSIISFLEFIDNMPSNRKEEFKEEFMRKFSETQISYKRGNETFVLNMYNVLVVFAQKLS